MPSEDVLDRLSQMQHAIDARLSHIEAQLDLGAQTFRFFDDALCGFRSRLEKDSRLADPLLAWLPIIQSDKSLRFSHRKVLECLLRRYDPASGQFAEMTHTQLWKESRVGKGRLRAYLRLLLDRGYVVERDDGYRKHYRVVAHLIRNRT